MNKNIIHTIPGGEASAMRQVTSIIAGLLIALVSLLPPAHAEGGAVVLCFDDGRMSTHDIALPLLTDRGWEGMAFINPGHVGNQSFLMDVAELEALDAADWDVASHGWTHRNPTLMDDTALDEHLRNARDWLREHGFWRGSRTYGPPAGNCDERVYAAAVELYRVIRHGDPEAIGDPPGLCAKLPSMHEYIIMGADDSVPWEQLAAEIDDADSHILILVFHDIVPEITGTTAYEASIERLEQTLEYIAGTDRRVVTMSDLLWQAHIYYFPTMKRAQ